ncbi:Hypothetical_protein [Hexamita inflata]|uniref:Hypothetical_protein n=1 Tax=Hexamita inflata TaxID=28002 RepID=A0AA86ULZ4_9EUKA|nr:Hypothetical protein HINF_LOCUS48329 [Hexamita inflata]
MDCRIFSDNNWSASNRLTIDSFRLIMLLFHGEVSLGVPGYAYVKELLFAIFYERYVGFVFLVSSVVIILANFFDFSNFVGVNHFIGQLSNKVIMCQDVISLKLFTIKLVVDVILAVAKITFCIQAYVFLLFVESHVNQILEPFVCDLVVVIQAMIQFYF